MAQYIYGPMEGATNSSSGKTGTVPAPASSDRNKFLKGDGTWGNTPFPPTMDGATDQTDGTAGLVPAPSAGDESKFLKGDGTWGDIPVELPAVTSSDNGKFLTVENGAWAATAMQAWQGGSY